MSVCSSPAFNQPTNRPTRRRVSNSLVVFPLNTDTQSGRDQSATDLWPLTKEHDVSNSLLFADVRDAGAKLICVRSSKWRLDGPLCVSVPAACVSFGSKKSNITASRLCNTREHPLCVSSSSSPSSPFASTTQTPIRWSGLK